MYEASQFFSPSFAAYARELAQRLVDQHQLRGGVVVEIGSGKGEFLGLLSELGDLEGVGFDPTYDGEVDGAIDANRVRFVRAFYDEDHATPRADLVVCRHVLEHLADPAVLLRSVAATIGARAVPVYFEVPNVGFVLSPAGMWDLIYPHVTYFSPPTLRWLFERCGFDVERIQTAFDDQFVVVDGRARAGRSTPPLPDPAAIATLRDQVHAFAAVFRSTIDRWSRLVHERAATGGEVVVWGAGAKGVTFLNLMPAGRGVSLVVDRNPRKHGTYISGTGQEVVPPDALRGRSIDTVIVMNRLYEDEIRAELADLDLAPTIVTV
jgi:SAM-dependent methyltransferase